MTLHYRNTWLILGWCWVGLVMLLCLMPSPPQVLSFSYADKLEHALTYALLMLWFGQLASQRRGLTAALLGLLGFAIELMQGMGTARLFEWMDIAANIVGVAVGWSMLQSTRTHFLALSERWLFSK